MGRRVYEGRLREGYLGQGAERGRRRKAGRLVDRCVRRRRGMGLGRGIGPYGDNAGGRLDSGVRRMQGRMDPSGRESCGGVNAAVEGENCLREIANNYVEEDGGSCAGLGQLEAALSREERMAIAIDRDDICVQRRGLQEAVCGGWCFVCSCSTAPFTSLRLAPPSVGLKGS